MRVSRIGDKIVVLGAVLVLSIPLETGAAHAKSHHTAHASQGQTYRHSLVRHAAWHYRGYGGIQCVTFAREETGIDLSGNAADWWYNAAGVYDRGKRPEIGSVLNFRANGRMRLGHVAVVNKVINSRLIEIDQAHWPVPGAVHGISHNIPVVDVSPDNDWSEVRVGLGQSGDFGSIYPTYGFIYTRTGQPRLETAMAITKAPAGHEAAVPATATKPMKTYDEVAEAPPASAGIDLRISDAPMRDIR
jgi:surface antigen